MFISPNFPEQFRFFCKALKEAGATVHGLGDTFYDDLHPELKESLTEYYKVSDMHSYDELVRALGFLTHKYGKIDRIDSLNEYWLETECLLRTDFNIPGIKAEQIDEIRKKSGMKKVFQRARVRTIRGELIQSEDHALKFIKTTGFPVVVKPNSGVGAQSTFRLNNSEDLNKFLKKFNITDFIIEEFIEGTLHSFDGLVDSFGNLAFCTAHNYSAGVMETVNDNMHIQYYSLINIPKKLISAGKRIIKAYGVTERFFHLEFFRTAAGEYIALEMNMRPPGGYTTDMFNWSTDADIYKTWADVIVKKVSGTDKERKYHCAFASRKNHLNYQFSHADIIQKYGLDLSRHMVMPDVFRSAMGDYAYIFRSRNEEKIHEITNFIHAIKD